jgi:hypothetical protein
MQATCKFMKDVQIQSLLSNRLAVIECLDIMHSPISIKTQHCRECILPASSGRSLLSSVQLVEIGRSGDGD